MASAAPRRSECTRTTSPRRTWASSEPMVIGLRRDRDVDRAALHQLRVGGPVDQRHHLARAEALGEHRREDVGLLGVGHRGEHVGAVDVLLDQQLLVGGVAVQHDGAAQAARRCAARGAGSRSISLTWLSLLERLRQAEADVAAAGDHDALAPGPRRGASRSSRARCRRVAARKNTSSPSSTTVSPSGVDAAARRGRWRRRARRRSGCARAACAAAGRPAGRP